MNRLYYSLDEPSALSSVTRLLNAVKETHPGTTRDQVEAWLRKQDTYTMHKPARRKLKAGPRVYVKHIDDQWCVDLCDMSNIALHNDGHRYILTCIDVLSKFAWGIEVKNKSGKCVTDAMERILSTTSRRPKRIESDKGSEFYNANFQALLQQECATHFSSNSRHKSSVVERFNRTLKTLLYRSFTARNSYNWTNVLQSIIAVYNNRKHRSIGTKPAAVCLDNEKLIWKRLYAKKTADGKLFQVGQLVRISKVKSHFEKGYLPNYTEEVFKISGVHRKSPIQYSLVDLLGEDIKGKFVSEELSPVDKESNDVWKIEKVIRRDRKGRYFVKWLGFPQKFNSWVDSVLVI